MKKLMLFTAALAASIALADRVTLKSGSYLTGTVVGAKSGELTFNSDDLGEITIKLENIAELEKVGTHTIQYNDGTEEQKVLSVADGKYVAETKPLDMAAVKAIDPVPETWHGNIDIGYRAAQGNSFENSASIFGSVNRRWENDRFNADAGYYYTETGKNGEDNQKTEDRWDLGAKHDHFWAPRFYNYEELRFERDMIQDLRARYRAGIGLGYQWLEKTEFESTGIWDFNQELGVNWIKEEYDNDTVIIPFIGDDTDDKKNGFCALRYAHHLIWQPKWVAGMEVFHNAEILPEVDDWEKFLAKVDLGFSTQLYMNFNLICKVEWEYNSKPANERKTDDFRFIVGLGYKW